MHTQLQAPPSSQSSCTLGPRQSRSPRRKSRLAEQAAGAAGATPEAASLVVVELPADIRAPHVSAGGIVWAAWAPGVTLLVADLALVERWDARSLGSLLEAYRDLARRRTEVRLVVWSRSLHEALQRISAGGQATVYASLQAALRPRP